METLKQSIDRIYHPYWLWEEASTNMWSSPGSVDHDAMLKKAIEFTGNHALYGSWMMRVVEEWTYSCEHNLSNRTQNRKAWLGHAACAHAFDCPEAIVREAWGYLSDEQRTAANLEATKAIVAWERKYAKEKAK